ncbi:MAG: hypothetical protein JNJ46_20140 [Myxococcales bacterium]|nr:hypothetical protein [Myxococcales bacterium]
MTQPQRNEERLLDYLYGELDAEARTQVEAELANNATLREELEGHRRVRRVFAELPRPEQSAESAQRMTALLMQQAAQHVAANQQSDPTKEGGGKLLAFQPRSLRRIFANPAAGIFAAAAAALFWVVFKTQAPAPQQPAESGLAKAPASAPSQPVALPSEAAPAALPTTVDAPHVAAKKSDRAQPKAEEPTVWAQLSRNAASDTLAREPERKAPVSPPQPDRPATPAQAKNKGKASLDGQLMALNDPFPPPAKSASTRTESAELPSRPMDDGRKDSAPAASGRYAAPPPVAAPSGGDAEGGVRAGVAQTQARRNQRIIEELANQELGAMPGGAGQAAVQGAPAPTAPQEPERLAQAEPSDKSAAEDESRNNARTNSLRSRETNAGPSYAQNVQATPAAQTNNVDRGSGLPLLTAVQDLLRQGRCAEANAALVRVEQSFPATRGLVEARAQWQRSCSPQGIPATPQNAERQMLAQPMESPQGTAVAAPAPRDALRSKRAAPARAKPTPPQKSAADSAAAY